MDFSTDNQAEMKLVEFQPIRKTYPVLQPQEEWKMDVRRRKPVKAVRCKVSVSFVNPLNRTIDWVRPFVIRQDGRIMGRGPTRFSSASPGTINPVTPPAPRPPLASSKGTMRGIGPS